MVRSLRLQSSGRSKIEFNREVNPICWHSVYTTWTIILYTGCQHMGLESQNKPSKKVVVACFNWNHHAAFLVRLRNTTINLSHSTQLQINFTCVFFPLFTLRNIFGCEFQTVQFAITCTIVIRNYWNYQFSEEIVVEIRAWNNCVCVKLNLISSFSSYWSSLAFSD